jgi:hypothetical protein
MIAAAKVPALAEDTARVSMYNGKGATGYGCLFFTKKKLSTPSRGPEGRRVRSIAWF